MQFLGQSSFVSPFFDVKARISIIVPLGLS